MLLSNLKMLEMPKPHSKRCTDVKSMDSPSMSIGQNDHQVPHGALLILLRIRIPIRPPAVASTQVLPQSIPSMKLNRRSVLVIMVMKGRVVIRPNIIIIINHSNPSKSIVDVEPITILLTMTTPLHSSMIGTRRLIGIQVRVVAATITHLDVIIKTTLLPLLLLGTISPITHRLHLRVRTSTDLP